MLAEEEAAPGGAWRGQRLPEEGEAGGGEGAGSPFPLCCGKGGGRTRQVSAVPALVVGFVRAWMTSRAEEEDGVRGLSSLSTGGKKKKQKLEEEGGGREEASALVMGKGGERAGCSLQRWDRRREESCCREYPSFEVCLVLVGASFWEAGSLRVVARRAMLYIVGLGLGDEKDITLRGLEAIKKCHKVYVEAYTSLLSFGISSDGLSRLENLYGKSVIVADREMVEERADIFLSEALESDVAFLVVGDPFGATTHADLVVRANKLGVEVQVIHNASVMNAIGICGLQLYRFGETVSIPFFTETWRPDSFYEKIHRNRQLGLHTLCLLDIQVKEPSLDHLCRGKKCYLPPRFMTINTAIHQLLEVEQRWGEEAYTEESKCIGVARLGYDDQMVVAGSMKELLDVDFGPPLHCLVIVGTTHHVEEEMLEFYAIK